MTWETIAEVYYPSGVSAYSIQGNQELSLARLIDTESGNIINETCLKCVVDLFFFHVPDLYRKLQLTHSLDQHSNN